MTDRYDGEPWAELVKKIGFVPENTESAARRVAEYASKHISELEGGYKLQRDAKEQLVERISELEKEVKLWRERTAHEILEHVKSVATKQQ